MARRKWLPTNFAARGSRVSHFTQSCLGFSSNLVPLVEVGSKAILHPFCISRDYAEKTRLFACFALQLPNAATKLLLTIFTARYRSGPAGSPCFAVTRNGDGAHCNLISAVLRKNNGGAQMNTNKATSLLLSGMFVLGIGGAALARKAESGQNQQKGIKEEPIPYSIKRTNLAVQRRPSVSSRSETSRRWS